MKLTNHRHHSPRPAAQTAGFTLIEVIGALAIVALIAGLFAQSGFERLRHAERASEVAELAQIIQGIEQAVVRTRTVPTAQNWATLVAGQLAKSPSQIAQTRPGLTRVLLFDPAFKIGPTATNTLPFTQSAGGSILPVNSRALLVSSTAAALPNLTTNDFAALWNTAAGTLPAGWPAGWGGTPADLKVERLDFSRFFRRVILNNLDSTAVAPYGVDGTNVVTIGALQRVEGWFVDTSLVNLYFSTGSLQARETLTEDTSYVFENGRWGRSVAYGAGSGSTDFGLLVDAFIDSPVLANTADTGTGTGTGSGSGSGSSGDDDDDDDDDADDDKGKDKDKGNGNGNNGHGNNEDGVDSSNPGQGNGGPNGQTDPSGSVDDEQHGCRSRNVAEACHKFLKSYSEWSNSGCPRGGNTPETEHPAYRNVKDACKSVRDFSRNLSRR
jgi:prepilin-type N-terminal cleavage/methylation domain-containing protein